jgi:NADH-quinone oxidoreductase subunit M
MDWPILSTITFLPLIGAVGILLINGDRASVARNSRYAALWTSLITFIICSSVRLRYRQSRHNLRQAEWLPASRSAIAVDASP